MVGIIATTLTPIEEEEDETLGTPAPEPVTPAPEPVTPPHGQVDTDLTTRAAQAGAQRDLSFRAHARRVVGATYMQDPDKFARAAEITKRIGGLPPDVIQNVEMFEAREREARIVSIVEDNPDLAKWGQDPTNMAISHDEIEALDELARLVRADALARGPTLEEMGFLRRNLDPATEGAARMLGSVWEALTADDLNNRERLFDEIDRADLAGDPRSFFSMNIRDRLASDYLREDAEGRARMREELAVERRENVEEMTRTQFALQNLPADEEFNRIQEEGTPGDILVAVLENPMRLWRLVVEAATLSAPALVAGAVLETPAAILATLGSSFVIEQGITLTESLARRDIDVTDADALLAAFADEDLMQELSDEGMNKGVGVALIDAVAMLVGRRIPLVSRVLGRVPVPSGAAQAMATAKGIVAKVPAVVRGTGRVGRHMAVQGGLEGGGEALGQHLAFDEVSMNEVTLEALAGSGAGESIAGAAYRRLKRHRATRDAQAYLDGSRRRAEAGNAQLAEIVAKVQEAKTTGRSPEAMEELLQIAKKGSGIEDILIAPEGLNEAFETPEQRAEFLAQVGITEQQLRDVFSRGGYLSIPMEKLATSTRAVEVVKAIAQDMKLSEDVLTSRETDLLQDLEAGKINALFTGMKEAQTDTTSEEVRTEVFNLLMKTGRISARDARASALLWQSTFSALAKRSGSTAKELYDQNPLNVRDIPFAERNDARPPVPAQDDPSGNLLQTSAAEFGVSPEELQAALAQAAIQRQNREITEEQYLEIISRLKPVTPYKQEDLPVPATKKEMRVALKKGQQERVGKAKPLIGKRVGLRLDIPAYENHDTWVPTIHAPNGKPLAHESVAHITGDISFTQAGDRAEVKAGRVGRGETSKAPFAQINGTLEGVSPTAVRNKMKEVFNDPDWVQVGYDPRRHTFFYDRTTQQPIVGATEVLQVGPLVMAKKPVYAQAEEFLFQGGAPAAALVSKAEAAIGALEVPEGGAGSTTATRLYNDEFPKETGADGRLTVRKGHRRSVLEVAQELHGERVKGQDRSEWTPENAKRIGQLMALEAAHAITRDGNAATWYRDKVQGALRVAALVHPEIGTDERASTAFRFILAVTSNGSTVAENSTNAFKIYESVGMTDYLGGGPKGSQPIQIPLRGFGKETNAMKAAFKMWNDGVKDMGVEAFMKFLNDDFLAGDLVAQGYDVSGELVTEPVKGSVIIGSKIGGGFFQNLMGNFDSLTMDLWFMRSWGRWSGTLIPTITEHTRQKRFSRLRKTLSSPLERKRTEKALGVTLPPIASVAGLTEAQLNEVAATILRSDASDKGAGTFVRTVNKKNPKTGKVEKVRAELNMAAQRVAEGAKKVLDQPAGGGHRNFMRQAAAEAITALKEQGIEIETADLQALLWYPEKDLYTIMGSGTKRTAPTDYQTEFSNIALAQGVSDADIQGAVSTGDERGGSAADAPGRRGRRQGEPQEGSGRDQGQEGSDLLTGGDLLQSRRAPEFVGDVIFEVAPDPNNVELAARWNALPAGAQLAISDTVSKSVLPAVLEAAGAEGSISPQIGSYLDDTNPSFSLRLTSGDPAAVASAVGFVLSQDSMVALSGDAFEGSFEAGAVRIQVGDKSLQEIDAIYQTLRGIEGFPQIGGQSTTDGQMTLILEEGVDVEAFSDAVVSALPSEYSDAVLFDAVNVSFPEKKDYDYGSSENDPAGESGLARQRYRDVRDQAAQEVATAIDQYEQGGPAASGNLGQGQDLLSRRADDAVRGSFRRADESGVRLISLFEAADASTFLHESAHFFLDLMVQMEADGSSALSADLDALRKWTGTQNLLSRDAQEKFAEAFEKYLFEGKAPSEDLRSAFAQFSDWLRNVYKNVAANIGIMDIEINDEIRGVMDRMVATDDAIQRAMDTDLLSPAFRTAEDANMTEAEFARYTKLRVTAEEQARDKMLARLLTDIKKERTAQYKAVVDDATAEVEDEMRRQPLWRVLSYLRNGEYIDPRQQADFEAGRLGEPVQIDRKLFIELFGEDVLKTLPGGNRKGGLTAAKRGVHPEVIANLFGFDAADQMIDAILALRGPDGKFDTFSSVAKEEAARRISEQEGVNLDPERLKEEAMQALHNADHGELISMELNILRALGAQDIFDKAADRTARKTGSIEAQQGTPTPEEAAATLASDDEATARGGATDTQTAAAMDTAARKQRQAERAGAAQAVKATSIPRAVVREAARRHVGRMSLEEMSRLYQYTQSELRASKKAEAAIAKRDYSQATLYKWQQMWNHYIVLEAAVAQRKGKTIEARLQKKAKQKPKKASVDPQYLQRIKLLLSAYGIGAAVEDRFSTLQDVQGWIAEQNAVGEDGIPAQIVVDPDLFVAPEDYDTIPFEQLQALDKAVRSLNKNGNDRSAREHLAFREKVDGLTTQIYATKKIKNRPEYSSLMTALSGVSEYFLGGHRKVEHLLRELDGFADLGTMWATIFKPINDASSMEGKMQSEASQKMSEIWGRFARSRGFWTRKYTFEGIGTLTKQEILAVALNWGNAGNRAAITNKSRGWVEADVEAMLNTLTDEEWNFVEEVWDMVNSYWPQIAALEERMTGVAPEKVEPAPFETSGGRTIRGGYYPLKFDAKRSEQASRNQETKRLASANMAGTTARAATQHGHTEARTGNSGPVRLSLQVMNIHLNEIIHDLTHREAVRDVARILSDKSFAQAMLDTHGQVMNKFLDGWIKEVAGGDVYDVQVTDALLRHARVGMSIAEMGFSFRTALVQPLGLTQSIAELGVGPVLSSVGQFFSAPFHHVKMINELSPEMANRSRQFNREVADSYRMALPQSLLPGTLGLTADGLTKVRNGAFWLIGKMDMAVAYPTWMAAYKLKLGELGVEGAVDYANQTVRLTQSSGLSKDLAAVSRGPEGARLFTAFYTFFSAYHNMSLDAVKKTGKKYTEDGLLPATVYGAAQFFWLGAAPALLGAWALDGGPDDDEDWGVWAAKELVRYMGGGLVIVREIVSALSSDYGYSGPAVIKVGKELANLVIQAADGEFDKALQRSAIMTAGYLGHLPGRQMWRLVEALQEAADKPAKETAAAIMGLRHFKD